MEKIRADRYTAVAIVLHWLIALAVLAMIPLGLWMSDAINDPGQQQAAYQAFQLHKSIGFLILALTLARLAWRLGHPVPALPKAMPGWERFAARATHAGFYALMLLLPLTGWIYVSTGWSVSLDRPLNLATQWFGLFQIPHLPSVAAMGVEERRMAAFSAMGAHEALAWGTVVLVALHVAAALKHQLKDKDAVLAGMVPWLKTDVPGETTPNRGPLPLILGVVAVVALNLAGGLTSSPPAKAPAVAGPPPGPTVSPASAPAPSEAAAPAVSEPAVEMVAEAEEAPRWIVNRAASRIAFSGTQAGAPFEGRFESWDADIRFDPENLTASKATVTIRTGSAKMSDATQEGSLGEAEWFDAKTFPTARFRASTFRALGGDRYEAVGTLTVKDRTVPVTLPFTLKIDGQTANAKGTVGLDRMALNLGLVSDAAAQWVSKTIRVSVEVSARRET